MDKKPTQDHPPTAYSVKGKVAIVTGAGSGISHALTKILLQEGCSVVMADLTLRPEAEKTLQDASTVPGINGKASAIFQQTDVSDWAQLQALFDKAIETYGTVNIVVNGAAIYEPPSSTFWQPPGVSPAARDKVDCNPGVYQTHAVNAMGPIRLAQIALNYWFYHPDAEMNFDGNLVWLSSVCGYVHLMQSPLYFSSKAAVNSMVKCLGPLRRMFGIRNAAVCLGPVKASFQFLYFYLSILIYRSCIDANFRCRLLQRPASAHRVRLNSALFSRPPRANNILLQHPPYRRTSRRGNIQDYDRTAVR